MTAETAHMLDAHRACVRHLQLIPSKDLVEQTAKIADHLATIPGAERNAALYGMAAELALAAQVAANRAVPARKANA